MSDRPNIQQQIDEVRTCLVSIKHAIEAWERVPEKVRRPDTGCNRSKIEPLQAAVKTLEWVRDHSDAIRDAEQSIQDRRAVA